MEPTAKTTVGIRTSQFAAAVRFLTEALNLDLVHQEKEKEYARFRLPSGQILEIFGSKSLWYPFTTPPDWEVILVDIRYTKEES